MELTLFHLTPMMGPPRKLHAPVYVCVVVGKCVGVGVGGWGYIHVYISIRIYTLTGVTSTYKQMSIQDPRGYRHNVASLK